MAKQRPLEEQYPKGSGPMQRNRTKKQKRPGEGPRRDTSDLPRIARQIAAQQAIAAKAKEAKRLMKASNGSSGEPGSKKDVKNGADQGTKPSSNEHSAFFKSTKKYEKRRANLDAKASKKKKKSGNAANEDMDEDKPRFERIKVGEVAQEPPKTLAIPKARFKVPASLSSEHSSTSTPVSALKKESKPDQSSKEESLVSVSWRKRRLKALPAAERVALEAERGLMIQKYREMKAAAQAERDSVKAPRKLPGGMMGDEVV